MATRTTLDNEVLVNQSISQLVKAQATSLPSHAVYNRLRYTHVCPEPLRESLPNLANAALTLLPNHGLLASRIKVKTLDLTLISWNSTFQSDLPLLDPD
jgi:hypothetical protein